jgi:hypothetical protein
MAQQSQPERLALTISQFAAAHGFSTAMYFKEKQAGRGPREYKVGRRTFITFEAAAEWRAEREAAHANPKGTPASRRKTVPGVMRTSARDPPAR